MDRQSAWARVRAAATAFGQWWAREVTRRRIGFATLAATGLLAAGVSLEALVRARIPDPASRAPTALYTRVSARGEPGRGPVPFATVGGSPLEARIAIPLAELPGHLVDAVLAVEDQRFHDHWGLDPRRIAGAMLANVRAGGISQGGSTITQQLAKNLFLTADRTPLRKLREAAMAVVLEARHTKDEILEAYLNEIYLGQDGGTALHGVGAAARYYFNKDARRLVVSEAATLAAMIPAPNRLSPQRAAAAVKVRRDMVLGLMASQGRISERTRRQSSAVAVPVRAWPQRGLEGRWFRDHVAALVPRGLPRRGAAVYTTLDPVLQRAAEGAVRQGLAQPGLAGAQAALVAIDPRTGEILAMVGGREYGASQFNRAVQALRQPGSAFKPVVALAALERDGDDDPEYTLASAIPDEPLEVRSGPGIWRPANYDGEYRGDVTLRQALEESLNVPFARVGLALGPERIAATARRLGITATLQPVPALALGASEISLLELVRAYGVLAAQGDLAESRAILGVSRRGTPLDRPGRGETRRVADPAATWLVTSALQGVVAHGTGQGLGRRGFAGKTGTSSDYRDAWFVAYTPELVVGVWVGHDDGRSLRRTGGVVAVPIAARFLAGAGIEGSGFPMPDGVVEGRVGGDRWVGGCGGREYFLEGTAPRALPCWEFDLADLDPRLGDLDLEALLGRLVRPGRPGRAERLLREADREALQEAAERLRELAGAELERARRGVERRLDRIRLR